MHSENGQNKDRQIDRLVSYELQEQQRNRE
jgi:hypothetical protein